MSEGPGGRALEQVLDRGVVRVALDVAVEPLQVTSWVSVFVFTVLGVSVAIAVIAGASAYMQGDEGVPARRGRRNSRDGAGMQQPANRQGGAARRGRNTGRRVPVRRN